MPRQPKPWFRDGRGWYIQFKGQQVFLGEHPPKTPHPQRDKSGDWHPPQSILDAFYEQMAGNPVKSSPISIPPDGVCLVTVLDAYLEWLQNRVREGSKAQRTYDWYLDYLQDFIRFRTDAYRMQDLTINELEPFHVYQWADSHPGWKTGKRGAIIAVQRVFNWAGKAGLLKSIGGRSPLIAIEKPQQGRREKLVSEDDYEQVRGAVNDQQFQDLLELSWETGCRPHELFTVEASYVELETARWIFPIRLSKGKKVQRVVYLSDRALAITQRLMLAHRKGLLLLNTEGRPWCVSSVKCRFQQICRALGRKGLRAQGAMPKKIAHLKGAERNDPVIRAAHEAKVLERRRQVNQMAKEIGVRLNLYAFRHSRITESLVNGLDAVTVSILAGHRDTSMISRHYAHLTQKHDHMRDAANRATGQGVSA
jgi:integrase